MDSKVTTWTFMTLFVALVVISVYILKPYLAYLFVGGLISYFVYPAYKRLGKLFRSTRIAAVVLSVTSTVIVFGILALVTSSFLVQAGTIYTSADQYVVEQLSEIKKCEVGQTSLLCQARDRVVSFVKTEDFQQKSIDAAKSISGFFAGALTTIAGGALSAFFASVIVLFSVFYFLDSGKKIKGVVLDLIPIAKSHKDRIYHQLTNAVNAVVAGNIGMAFLQGLVGAIVFALFGISAAIFWGFVMTVAAFIPAVGPLIVFLPVAIMLILSGAVVRGVALFIVLFIVLGYIDNVLKPKIIGSKIKLSSFVVFLGAIGGLSAFGLLGMFLGPIIFALLAVSVTIYKEDFAPRE